jgi:DNA ligase-associated metallophosphoesterase
MDQVQGRATAISATTEFGGEELHLLPERAVWWPAEGTLFVADLHVGKEASFRAAGLPVPDVFVRDLARLSHLIQRLTAKRVLILGDLLHDRSAHGVRVVSAFTAWRRTMRGIHIGLIRGNHDRRAGDPPSGWNVECLDEPSARGNLQLRHRPRFEDAKPTLAGHLHPKFRMIQGPDHLRLPCFLMRRKTLVLPAFGDFIDHAVIARQPNDSVFVVAGSEVIQIADG